MSQAGETFFTVVGCMDGRVQEPMHVLGQEKFGADYPDTITEAGIVGIIANNPSQDFLDDLKFKLLVSVDMHHSKGILVDGHEGCAGHKVDNEQHIEDVKKSVKVISDLIGGKVQVIPVFVKQTENGWEAEEV